MVCLQKSAPINCGPIHSQKSAPINCDQCYLNFIEKMVAIYRGQTFRKIALQKKSERQVWLLKSLCTQRWRNLFGIIAIWVNLGNCRHQL